MIYEVIPHLKMGTVGYHSSKVILERTRLLESAEIMQLKKEGGDSG